MTACGYMNPEYEEDELDKALQWAVWASETDEPVCFLAVYPEWRKATYMNLLSHDNVQVVARFQRNTFAFLPPDHWAASGDKGPKAGTARWQVMVIEISNRQGREKYKKGDTALIARAGRSFGAKPESNNSINTNKRHRRRFPSPNKQFQDAPRLSPYIDSGAHPGPTPCLNAHITLATRRFPAGRRVFTDGSLIDRQGVGAAYYDEHTAQTTYIYVDQKDILRAELTAILRIVQDREADPELLQVFTDSLTSIRLLRRWVHCPTALSKTDNLDLLDSLAHAIAQRAPARTEIYKVRAHIGCEGNELADTGAKRVASGETEGIEVVNAHTTHNPTCQATNPFTMADGTVITKPKVQLRQTITDWLTVTRGLMTTVSDMWQGEDASKLDPVASNTLLWGTGTRKGMYRPLHVLRFRFLEVVTNAKLHDQNPAKNPSSTCDLCTQTGTWFHMASMCPHPDISEYYTVRHNAAGKELTKGIRAGKLGRWLTITSFGRTDGQPDPETIPGWMLSDRGRARAKLPIPGTAGDAGEDMAGGIRPDIMILENWPETSAPPRGPTQTYSGKKGEIRKVKVIIAELGFSSDLGFQKTVDRKQRKYGPLIRALEEEGWTVDPTIHVITVGVRATVPLRNAEVLKCLGVVEKSIKEVQSSMTRVAAAHLNRIVPQYRKLCKRQININCNNNNKTGVG